MNPLNLRWIDPLTGTEHIWPTLFGWHCTVHGRVCSPATPPTDDDLLRLAARDLALADDAFIMLRQSIDGEIGGAS